MRWTHEIVLLNEGHASSRRNTLGGPPILAKGQSLPNCGLCCKPLALLVQFDISDEFDMPFESGSHFLMFGCLHCVSEVPHGIYLNSQDPPSIERHPDVGKYVNASACLILNRNGFEESVMQVDESILETSIEFRKIPEEHEFSSYAGQDTSKHYLAKVGGIPNWPHCGIQLASTEKHRGSYDISCTCGERYAFLAQFPSRYQFPGIGETYPAVFAQGFITIFACVAQCKPTSLLLRSENY